MPKLVKNYILIRYEDLRDDYNNTLEQIQKKFKLIKRHTEYKGIDTYKGSRGIPYKQSNYSLESSVKDIISRNLNKEIEEQLGYKVEFGDSPTNESNKIQEVFSTIYHTSFWGSQSSRSGSGSDLIQTQVIRNSIPRLIQKYNVKVFLDAPCGDYYWMKSVPLLCEYIGVDIVPDLINNNNKTYGNKFRCLDLTKDPLPRADMILCRDCLG